MTELNRNRARQGAIQPPTALGKAFDLVTRAHVVRAVGPAVRYRTDDRAANAEQDGPLTFHRTVAVVDGADDAPNTTAPEASGHVVGSGGCDAVTCFAAFAAATMQLGLEVWCRTDIHVDGTSATAWIWVLVEEIPQVVPYREYTVQTGQRPTFLRVASVGGAGQAELYATAE
jgi:hypothetical protein